MQNKGTNFLLPHCFYTNLYYVMKGQNDLNEILKKKCRNAYKKIKEISNNTFSIYTKLLSMLCAYLLCCLYSM